MLLCMFEVEVVSQGKIGGSYYVEFGSFVFLKVKIDNSGFEFGKFNF